jgi:hypothetical protein
MQQSEKMKHQKQNENSNRKFKLTVNKKQLQVIKNAVDCYKSIVIGNYKKVLGHIQKTKDCKKLTFADKVIISEHIRMKIGTISNEDIKKAKERCKHLFNIAKHFEIEDDNLHYTVICDNDTILKMERAMEMYSRLGIKQYGIVFEYAHFEFSNSKHILTFFENREIEQSIRNRESLNMSPNASYGIYCREVNDKFRCAWDMYQVIRYARSWADAEHKPEERYKHFITYMTHNYDPPMKSSNQPLAKCEVWSE